MTAHRQITPAHKEQGFTLVEILIALTIFAIGILGIASMQVWGLRGNASAVRHSEAATLVQDQIEQLMTIPYTTLVNGAPYQAPPVIQRGYTITYSVNPGPIIRAIPPFTTTNPPLTTTITINVTWNEHGTVKTFTPDFTFYRAMMGPN